MNSIFTKSIIAISCILILFSINGQSQDPNKIQASPIDFPNEIHSKSNKDDVNFQVAYDIENEEENWSLMDENFTQLKEEIGQLLLNSKESGSEKDFLNSDKNFSSLSEVNNPNAFPFRTNCKMKMRFADGWSSGSAVIIDAYHVLTAAHCVYDYEDGQGWAKEIYILPAYDNGTQSDEYDYAKGKHMYSFSGYTNNGDLNWDIALIKLDRPIGLQTGWITYGYNNSNSFFKNNSLHNGSYPSESPYNGRDQYYSNGTIDNTYTHKLRHNRTVWKGMSGSGMYYKNSNGKRIVYGIASHRVSNKGVYCRINSTKFNSIKSWIKSNTSSSYDLSPHYMENTNYVYKGELISKAKFKVLNEGRSKFDGTMTAKFYLSTNSNITTYDTEIGTLSYDYTLSSRSKKSMLANNRLRIPTNINAGTYYIGVILTNQDGKVSNNRMQGLTAGKITVLNNHLDGSDGDISSNLKDKEVETFVVNKRNNNHIEEKLSLENFPNPFRSETTIQFELAKEQDYTLMIYDASGKQVYQKQSRGHIGSNQVFISESEIPNAGKYIYTLKTHKDSVSKLLVKI